MMETPGVLYWLANGVELGEAWQDRAVGLQRLQVRAGGEHGVVGSDNLERDRVVGLLTGHQKTSSLVTQRTWLSFPSLTPALSMLIAAVVLRWRSARR